MSALSKDILAQRPVALYSVETGKGARIVLEGMEADVSAVSNAVTETARGFPIAVSLNGIGQLAEHADGPDFVDTPIGRVRICGVHGGERKPSRRFADRIALYLQGLPLKHRFAGSETVVHLDAKQFFGTWPDREHLNQEREAVAQVQAHLDRLMRAFLQQEHARLGDIGFIDAYVGEFGSVCPALFRDVELVHKNLLSEVDTYPEAVPGSGWEVSWGFTQPEDHVKKEALERGEVVLIDVQGLPDPEENLVAWMACYRHSGVLAVVHASLLPAWAQPFVLRPDDLRVEALGAAENEEYYSGHWISGDVVFCEAYRILRPDGQEIARHQADGMYWCRQEEDSEGELLTVETFFVPHDEHTGKIVRQASTFQNEWEERLDNEVEQEVFSFRQFLMATRDQDAASVLRTAIEFGEAPQYHALRNKRFVVEIDQDGRVKASEQASDRISVTAAYEGENRRGIRFEADRDGDPGIYDELRVGAFEGDRCIADVLIGLSPDHEVRLLLSGNGEGESDHVLAVYPERTGGKMTEKFSA
jgi:hypothetical protein